MAGCGSEKKTDAKEGVTVNIASFRFTPDPVKVKAGGTVTWVNQDKAPHTAQTTSAFDTGRLDTGGKKAVKLDRAGTYRYFCVYHRFMTGTVEVVE